MKRITKSGGVRTSRALACRLALADDLIKRLGENCAPIISSENRVSLNNYLRTIGEKET